jgi:hypothetical protein
MTRHVHNSTAQKLDQAIHSGKVETSAKHYSNRLPTRARKLWNFVAEFFSSLLASPSQPQIKERRDRHGRTYWRVHDPATGRSVVFYSEQEVCTWLEQRWSYYMR